MKWVLTKIIGGVAFAGWCVWYISTQTPYWYVSIIFIVVFLAGIIGGFRNAEKKDES